MKISDRKLREQCWAILSELGVQEEAARTTVDALVQASLFGIDSHGIRLFPHYVGEVARGAIQGSAVPFYEQHGSFIDCDAGRNFSHFAARGLLDRLAPIASAQGIAFGTIRNSDHIGALGIHAVNAQRPEMVILGFTNANPLAVDPNGGATVFGTNPLSLVSGQGESLVYIDLATTQFTMNKVKLYGERGLQLPNGVARDRDFFPTTSPQDASSLEPIGGHKGFAIAFLVEVLTSGLAGGPHSSSIPDMYSMASGQWRNLSHTFIVIDPRVPGRSEASNLTALATAAAMNQSNRNELPGRREIHTQEIRAKEGIPVDPSLKSSLEKVGVKFD